MLFQIGSEIVLSYKRLSYSPSYALAEFIDNSTQAYVDNSETLDKAFAREGKILEVIIKAETDAITISDNSIGMSQSDLEKAIIVGRPPENNLGRSKYGLGLKTAAFWFGNEVTITTKKLGEVDEVKIVLNVEDIAHGNPPVTPMIRSLSTELHYTIIEIRNLNRKIDDTRAKAKVKDYLRSFYRVDLSEGKLKLFFNAVPLTWSYEELDDRLLKRVNGTPTKRNFTIVVNGKPIHGWAGVLQRGSRALGGFSLLQAKRVVKGWPKAFKTELIFGQQEGGSNDLINQRLIGELYVDGFNISHTKDEILFTDEELDELDKKLYEELKDLMHIASTNRKSIVSGENTLIAKYTNSSMLVLDSEISSPEFLDALSYEVEIPQDIAYENKVIYLARIREAFRPKREFVIGDITVVLYILEDVSINDPYLTIEPVAERMLIIVVSQSHPHWNQLDSENAVLNFLRHCIYDGLAEWKTSKKMSRIDPDTVKAFKDQFLRIPFEMDIHSQPIQEVSDSFSEEELEEE